MSKWNDKLKQEILVMLEFGSSTTKTLDTYGGGLCVMDSEPLYKKDLEYQSSQSKTNK